MVTVQEPDLSTIQRPRNLLHFRQVTLLCWKWYAIAFLNQLISLYVDRAPPKRFMAKGHTSYLGMIRAPTGKNSSKYCT